MNVLSSSMQSVVAVLYLSVHEFAAMGVIEAMSLHHTNRLCIFLLTQIRFKSDTISSWSRRWFGSHQVYSDGFLCYNLSSGGRILINSGESRVRQTSTVRAVADSTV